MNRATLLTAVPTLAHLLERPERVADVSPKMACALLAQLVPLQTALLARVLGGVTRQTDPTADRCISVEAAAARLGVSQQWVYKHRATLPFVRTVGTRIRCSDAGVTAWLEGQRLA